MAKTQNHIDFDFWLHLAQSDPERFESLRTETLEKHIQRAADNQQNRLRCLQWRIDRIRDRAKTPMAACISISDMMWDTFNHLASGYNHIDHLRNEENDQLASATVIDFEPRQP
ncbi:MAG: DUF3135 domain-containing protein [Gammaproteobacteria bacterium]|jgi:hypothetical protein